MSQEPTRCGLEAALDVIGGKWKPIVLWHLTTRARRFGELRRLVTGISEKMLIQQLREMQHDGIVARQDFGEIPPRVEYSLTTIGIALGEALRPLCDWGNKHAIGIEEARIEDDPSTDEATPLPGLVDASRIH